VIPAAAKALARRALAAPAPYALLRARAAARGPATAILCYHTLAPDDETLDAWTALRVADFRAQLDALRAEREIVALEDALGAPRRGGGRPRAVLTFDDGEAGLRRHLLPIVEAERIPVTIYVATGQIETGRAYWFDRTMNALQAEGAFALDLADHGLGRRGFGAARGPARWAAISDLLEAMKRLEPGPREAAAAAVAERAPAGAGFTPLAPLTPAGLAELARHPLVTIGAHSHGHELLDRIPAAAARASMARSRALLEAWTGRAVRHFAYPNGNHDAAVRGLAAAAGFRTAAALDGRLHRPGGDPLALSRLGIGRYDDAIRLRLRLVGI
jgi:peptidoglycan/xylan/chitin deacetylase (PgdA/CDA1 family)